MAQAKPKAKKRNRAGEYVLCPLYIANSDREIQCRSHLPDSSSTIHKYQNENYCKRQRNIFCEGCWKRCEHYISWEHFRWEDEE